MIPPGLSIGLYHNLQERTPPTVDGELTPREGGDLGASAGQGFLWWEAPYPANVQFFDYPELPPGLVIGLKHSSNMSDINIPINGVDVLEVVRGIRSAPDGLVVRVGGDLGAPRDVGFYWYETIGNRFDHDNLLGALQKLPNNSVVALKHNTNMRNITSPVWWTSLARPVDSDVALVLDPVRTRATINVGDYSLQHINGGDRGARSGQGFYYFRFIRH